MKKQSGYFTFAWLLFFSFFFVLMAQLTLRYIPLSKTVAFLQIKQTEVSHVKPYLPIFYVHVYTAIFCLLAGFTQFNNKILGNYKKLHRAIGYVYVLVVIFFAGPSGVYMGWYANGGWTAKISFILLGLLWIFFTLNALHHIRLGNIKKHRHFMLRSFALAFSAITLRLWKVVLVYLFHPAPMDVYQIIAWLGWIPNLLIVEYLIGKDKENQIL